MKKLFTLIAVAVLAFAAQANVLSVCQGENFSIMVPVYGYWYDTPGFTQQIYPADMLADMAGGEITEISFLTRSCTGEDIYASYTIKFYGGQVTLALKEVNELGFTETVAMAGATVVASTTPEEGDATLDFVLDEPFQYNGGNLLVEVNVAEVGTYGSTYFWGTSMDYTPTYSYDENYSGGVNTVGLMDFLCAADFTYTEGQVTPPEPPTPTEKTGAPTFNGYTTDGIHAYFVEIVPTEPSTIYYRIQYPDGTWTDWAEYEDVLSFTGDGKYRVEAYAVAPGKLPSEEIAYEFVVAPLTGISEMVEGKTVANTRYFNMAGQEMQEANGPTIVVTTYTDGTTSTAKVMK